MGLIRKLVLGRWAAKWLLRGGPWAVAAKLAGVALYGAWQWRREHEPDAGRPGEIEADYEVIDDAEPAARPEPSPRRLGTMNSSDRSSRRDEFDPNTGAEDDAT